MPWSVSLCVYKSPQMTDVGHAFATVSNDDRVVAAAGLSPGQLPATFLDEMLKVIPGPGRIFSEWDSLDDENLRTRTWVVGEGAALRVMNKINADRRSNVALDIPDGDHLPAHALVAMAAEAQEDGNEWAGGPNYALLWSNCATYALDLVAEAGIDVAQYRSIRPSYIHGMLNA